MQPRGLGPGSRDPHKDLGIGACALAVNPADCTPRGASSAPSRLSDSGPYLTHPNPKIDRLFPCRSA